MSEVVGTILGTVGAYLIRAWILMLFPGAVHHDYFQAVPAIGYIPAFVVVLTFDVMVASPVR